MSTIRINPPAHGTIVTGVSLRDVLLILTRRWKEIAAVTAAFLFVGLLASFVVIRPSYTSVVIFLPPYDPRTSQPIGSGLCTAMLNSQSLDDGIVGKLQLQTAHRRQQSPTDARLALKSEVQIQASNNGLVTIIVRDQDPKLASDIANEYMSELNALTTRLAQSDAAYRHSFLERQTNQEKDELQQAEDRLQEVQQRSSLINPGGQLGQAVLNVSQLHAAIAARSVDLQSMERYASDTNPDVIQLRATIAELQKQLSDRQNSTSVRALGNVQIPAGAIAGLALEHQRALRDVTLHSEQFEQLMLQLALARANLTKVAPAVLVIDRAVMADFKSGPQRILLWLASCLVGLFAACLYVFLGEAMARSGYGGAGICRLLWPRCAPSSAHVSLNEIARPVTELRIAAINVPDRLC